MRRWGILNGILAVIVLGFTVQIVRTWARTLPPIEARPAGKGGDVPARTTEGGKRSKRAQGDKAPSTPVALVNTIVDKDLFDPSRTRQTEEAKAQTVLHETAPPPGITLVGVRAFGKDSEGFILDATQANTQRRVRLGDAVGNFTVKRIRMNSILLVSSAGDFVTLSLEVDKSKGGTTTGASTRPGRAQAAAAGGGAASPAAGVTGGAPTAAGPGGVPRPPTVAAGTAAAAQNGASGAPAIAGVPAQGTVGAKPVPGGGPTLPEGVRQKLEQMKRKPK